MATILKSPKLKKGVYFIKILLIEELRKENVKISNLKAENVATKIYKKIHDTFADEVNNLKKEKDSLQQEINKLNSQKEKIVEENNKLTNNLEETKKLISEKQTELNEIINKIKDKNNELKELYKETYEKARKEGEKKGIEEAKQQTLAQLAFIDETIDMVKQEIENILSNTKEEREKILTSTEEEIIKLAVEIAKKIVKVELTQNKKIIIQVVKEALKKVIDKDKVRIIVNPNDLKTLNSYKDEIAQLKEGIKSFEITTSSNITPGGCIIETNLGNIDATIERAEREIEKEMMG